jgi:hypothetical protein
MKRKLRLASTVHLESRILTVRGQKVILDYDLAKIYGVTTAALNQAVQRNEDRFPDDFSFRLSQPEIDKLISQNVISKPARGGRNP